MKASLKRRDYHKYEWERKEWILATLKSVAAVAVLAYFFYRSILAAIPLSLIGYLLFERQCQQKKERSMEELTAQFRECILAVAASLKAGYAVENAFMESCGDMYLLYGEQSYIYKELQLMRRGLVINITLEEQLMDLAHRSDCEEIYQFAQIFAIAKRNGGNLPEIIRSSAELIGQRIEARLEIETLLSGRRMELNIMKIMPFAILEYVGISNPGYFDGLYHNLQGAAIMTGCMGLYLGGYVLGEHIMKKIALDLK